jgi:hypothetical protein
MVWQSDEQQIGKGTVFNFLKDYVFGDPITGSTNKMKHITGDNNYLLANKVFFSIWMKQIMQVQKRNIIMIGML